MATYRDIVLPNPSDLPDGPGALLAFAQSIAPRILTGVDDFDELVTFSATEYEGAIIHLDEGNLNVQAIDGSWVQINTATFASASARNAAYAKASGAYRVAGIEALDTSSGITSRYNGSAWKLWSSPPITFTPTLTNFTLGSGSTVTAKYQLISGWVVVELHVVLGTGGAFGTDPKLTLPIERTTPMHIWERFDGEAMLLDASAAAALSANYNAAILTDINSTTLVRFVSIGAQAAGITSSAPFASTVSDALDATFRYLPA